MLSFANVIPDFLLNVVKWVFACPNTLFIWFWFPQGGQILQQLHAQLNPIPEEVLEIGAEIMARRIDLLNLLREKHRADRSTYLTVCI